jgi:hypothetical protein
MSAYWKVIYQSTPYNYTAPSTLVVEAETREDAYVVAYDHLTRTGIAVSTESAHYDLKISVPSLEAKGVPFASGDCHIRSIEPHSLKAIGKVIA